MKREMFHGRTLLLKNMGVGGGIDVLKKLEVHMG